MPRSSDLFLGGIDALAGGIQSAQNYYREDLEARDDRAKQNAMADPLIQDAIERIMNGESPDDVANDHLAREYHKQQPSLTRQPSPGPWAAGYDNGPDQGPMIPYSEPVRSSRLPNGPMASMQPVGGGDPGIQNKDVPDLMKLGGMLQTERYRDANLGLGYDRLGLGYDKLDAQKQKDVMANDYRSAMADYIRAKNANMPEQMALARRRADIAAANLGISTQKLGLDERKFMFSENKEYLKNTNETAWAVPAIDNILMKARTTPGMVPPPEDYTKRRVADMLGRIPFAGGFASSILTRSADQDLTQAQRDFRRQVQLAITPFRKLIVGSQITQGEADIINELAGGQLSIEDTIAGLAALRQMMMTKQGRNVDAFPSAAGRIGNPTTGQTLPPLSSGITNDPYGLGALSETPELDYFKSFGYTPGQ